MKWFLRIVGIALCLFSFGGFVSGDTTAALFVLILGLGALVVAYNMGIAKRSVNIPATDNDQQIKLSINFKPAPVKRASEQGIDFARDYFDLQWKEFLKEKGSAFKVTNEFLNTVGLAFDRLTPDQQDTLFLSFVSVSSDNESKTRRAGISISIGLDSTGLYEKVWQLLKSGKPLTVSSLFDVFQEQIRKAEKIKEEEAKRKTVRYDSVIDITDETEEPIDDEDFDDEQEDEDDDDPYQPKRLGTVYQSKLGLSDQEAGWLNKFWDPRNSFLSIEGCCIATMRLYVAVMRELEQNFRQANLSLEKESEALKVKIARKLGGLDYDKFYAMRAMYEETAEANIYMPIFKRVENQVREQYGHKRKLTEDFSYPAEFAKSFESLLGDRANAAIQKLKHTVPPPDEPTQQELNAQNVTRWKPVFDTIASTASKETLTTVITAIHELARLNNRNPNVESIFYEGAKLVAKFDKAASLRMYIQYVYSDLQSSKFDGKALNKTVQKSLFKNAEEVKDFETIISNLIKDRNLEVALQRMEVIFQPKRRKITLDKDQINEVKQQHAGTVDKLNVMLDDMIEGDSISIVAVGSSKDELELAINTNSKDSPGNTLFPSISLTQTQEQLIAFIVAQQFFVPAEQLDIYAREKNVFKNQVIDSINEVCYERLDDVLIEEEGDGYRMNEDYFQKLKYD